jgi:hypothetical protein
MHKFGNPLLKYPPGPAHTSLAQNLSFLEASKKEGGVRFSTTVLFFDLAVNPSKHEIHAASITTTSMRVAESPDY